MSIALQEWVSLIDRVANYFVAHVKFDWRDQEVQLQHYNQYLASRFTLDVEESDANDVFEGVLYALDGTVDVPIRGGFHALLMIKVMQVISA